MMIKRSFACLGLICVLAAACQAANPTIEAPLNTEFTLARDQSARIKTTDLTVTFSSVLSDDRCPIEVECAASGPVTVSLAIHRAGEDLPVNVTMETFTDQEGRAPAEELEGVEPSADIGEYVIHVVSVLPYPRNLSGIKASDYQATFIVIPK
ncbi:MAG TPA: hypothetical protein VFY25_14965 [Anaerolineales bacterium]|nr:hypothetical protein [Anaerolineales bacterium]